MADECAIYVSFVPETSAKFERHKLSSVNLKEKVLSLQTKVAEIFQKKKEDLHLVFLGRSLNGDDTLEDSGIKSGMTVFVYPHHEPEKINTNFNITEDMLLAFRTAIAKPAFRNVLQSLTKTEVLEGVMAATPALADDPIAVGYLQDPELMMLLASPAHLKKMVEKHPALIEAATQIAVSFHAEGASGGPAANNGIDPPPISYSLDALSDDDDMGGAEMEQGMASGSGSLSPNRITPQQLAAALAAAATATPGSPSSSSPPATTGSPRVPPSPRLWAPPPTPRNPITSEMFSNAMQSALESFSAGPMTLQVPPASSGNVAAAPPPAEDTDPSVTYQISDITCQYPVASSTSPFNARPAMTTA
ncbi:ubiquitin-like protein 7 isoform X2 [Ornithodoros turicata]|uniref:ubiquitin-like protein 7 isoform X2 n=1 Tax=Ornithodoros turicata TaxID=34597 RepID=UPI003138EDA3